MNKAALRLIDLPVTAQLRLVAGARDLEPVHGMTHAFYKYPARFSPTFARTVIETFSRPSDLVLDNHVGGGTTLVEALALGRDAVGVDISSLAEFVTTVKTTVFGEAELEQLTAWAKRIADAVHLHKWSLHFSDYADRGYYKHLDHPARWRLRKAVEQGLTSAMRLTSPRLEAFGRCVVLRTAQWALDGRKRLPTIDQFRDMLRANALDMVAGARELLGAVKHYRPLPKIRVLNRSAAGLEDDHRIARLPAPKLVITSPPYPGVHVLYHRWQVDGRKESPLPFLIADKLDGAGSSYYTMGDRHYPELKTYFENIRATMASVTALADDETIVVQMLAFSDPSWQLDHYLQVMEEVGLEELYLPKLRGEADGRLWRRIPNRKWHANRLGDIPPSQEVVLFFRREAASSGRVRERLRHHRTLMQRSYDRHDHAR